MNLIGMTRDEIAHAVRDKSRAELIDLLHDHVSFDPWFKPQEIADRRRMSKWKVMDLVRRGILKAHKPLDNAVRIPLSSIRAWDKETALSLMP